MNTQDHLSSELLDLLSLSALDEDARRNAHAHLETCAACRARWDELQDSRDYFATVVFRRTASEVSSRATRAESMRSHLRRVWGIALPLAALIGISAVIAVLVPDRVRAPATAPASAFTVDPAGARWALIATADASGKLTGAGTELTSDAPLPVHVPSAASGARATRVFVLLSDGPIALEALQEALDRGEAPSAIPGVRQAIVKDLPR